MTQLSTNFSLEELTFSEVALRKGLQNIPSPDQIANLTRLATSLLEPVRVILGVPLHVNSGYRSPSVNAAVGGAPDSAHMDGRAADLVPIGRDLHECFEAIRTSGLAFDQLIIECGAWLHIAVAVDSTAPRQQALTATGGPGAWRYQLVA